MPKINNGYEAHQIMKSSFFSSFQMKTNITRGKKKYINPTAIFVFFIKQNLIDVRKTIPTISCPKTALPFCILGVLTRHSLHFYQKSFPEDTHTIAVKSAVETISINVNIQSKRSYSYSNIHPQVLL